MWFEIGLLVLGFFHCVIYLFDVAERYREYEDEPLPANVQHMYS